MATVDSGRTTLPSEPKATAPAVVKFDGPILKVHAIKSLDIVNLSIKAKCGRFGFPDKSGIGGKWGYVSRSGETRFQAVDPHDTADTTPRISCIACLKMIAHWQRVVAKRLQSRGPLT